MMRNGGTSNAACQAGAAVLLTLILSGSASGATATARPYEFKQDGRHYTFTSQFTVAASPSQVLEILYPVENLRQYSKGEGSVDLIDEGPGWQLVQLTHTTLLWTFSATVRREIRCDGHCIAFHMLQKTRSGIPIPAPISSDGKYVVEPAADGAHVTFTQSVEAPDTILLRPWMAFAKSHAISFAHDIESYVRSQLH